MASDRTATIRVPPYDLVSAEGLPDARRALSSQAISQIHTYPIQQHETSKRRLEIIWLCPPGGGFEKVIAVSFASYLSTFLRHFSGSFVCGIAGGKGGSRRYGMGSNEMEEREGRGREEMHLYIQYQVELVWAWRLLEERS